VLEGRGVGVFAHGGLLCVLRIPAGLRIFYHRGLGGSQGRL
jgi:hypothetical protein